jgi:hypothetical protein
MRRLPEAGPPPRVGRHRRAALRAALAAALAAPAPAQAAEWYARSRLSLETGYDDNVRLSADDETDAFETTLSPRFVLGGRSQALEVQLDTRLDFTRYWDEPDLDTDDQFLRLQTTYTGRRATLGLAGSFERDTATDDDDDDGRQQLGSERRVSGGVAPTLRYTLSPRHSLELAGGVDRRIYPDAQGASSGVLDGRGVVAQGLGVVQADNGAIDDALSGDRDSRQNYWRYSLGLTWLYQLQPRTALGLGPSFLYLDQPRQELALASLQGLVRHALTPRLTLDGRAGPSVALTDSRLQRSSTRSGFFEVDPGVFVPATEFTFTEEHEEETTLGFVADAGLAWQATRRTDLTLRLSRQIEPSGSEGEAVTRDRVSLGLDHELSRTVAFFLNTSWLRQGAVSSDTGDDGDRTTIRFEPGIRWSLTPDLDLTLRYRLRYREFESTDQDATSNAVLLRLDLKLPDLRTSW